MSNDTTLKRGKDMTGLIFGRLTVTGWSHSEGGRVHAWRCVCECGKETVVVGSSLRRGTTQSCGCFMRERATEAATTHGLTGTKVHIAWVNMRMRCFNPNGKDYPDYGGRGITVCERWLKFENFLADMGEPHSPDLSVERRDVNGNYEPSNCYWATQREQASNKRNNRFFECNGERLTLAQWARRLGINHAAILKRLKLGWDPIKAITTPKSSRFTKKAA